MLAKIIVSLIAGLGAGMGTGIAGLSAAAVISPMLITFLDVEPYQAVGIALASDVLASAASAYTYGKNKNLDIRNGVIMMISVLCFTLAGSFIASLLPGTAIGGFSVVMTTLLGVKFLVKPVTATESKMMKGDKKTAAVQSALCGMMIGFICGFVGAGGGMMMLFVLGYELKTAVGTSVFIMSFTALTGAASHFIIDGAVPDISILAMCIIFTLAGAAAAARFANKASPRVLNRAVGGVLLALGATMIVTEYIL